MQNNIESALLRFTYTKTGSMVNEEMDQTNSLDSTMNWNCSSKLYFNFSKGNITYPGIKTESHYFFLKEKLFLKWNIIR